MAKRTHTPDMIEEFESAADRLAGWIASNAWLVGGVLVIVLGTAGAWGGYHSWSQGREEAASNALERTRSAYLFAFGAPSGTIEEPELANPALADGIREDYVESSRRWPRSTPAPWPGPWRSSRRRSC